MKNEKLYFPKNINPFCKKKMEEENSTCSNFRIKMPYGFSVCPYGFSCYKKEDKVFCAFKIKNYFDEKKYKGHIRNSSTKLNFNMSYFTEEDFIYYCANNDLESQFENIKEKHEIYRSTIHDIKSAIRFMEDIFEKINLENDLKDIMDGYDLIRTRLDYHDRILMGDNKIAPVINKLKLHKLLKKLTLLLKYYASNKNINFELDCISKNEIFSDSKAIFIMLFIFIENATKYSPKDENIKILMKDLTRQCTMIEISNICTDIDNNELQFIFDDGYRGKNSVSCSGNGIGLMVAKKIMNNLHINHSVELEKKDNKIVFSLKIFIPSLRKDGTILETNDLQSVKN